MQKSSSTAADPFCAARMWALPLYEQDGSGSSTLPKISTSLRRCGTSGQKTLLGRGWAPGAFVDGIYYVLQR